MIDLRTLLLVVAAVDAIVAVLLLVGTGRRLKLDLAGWIAALFARSLAMGVMAIGVEPRAGALAISGGLLALSMTLQAGSLLAHEGRRLPTWVHTAVMAGVAVPLPLLAADAADTILFGGLVYGTLLVVLAALASQLRAASAVRGMGYGLLITCFSAGAVVFFIRGLAAVFSAEPMAAFNAPTAFQAGTFVFCAAIAISSSFAFLLLHKERAEYEAMRLATLDPLTGAYNRRVFHEIAERELARARRAGQPLSIIILDIDHFRAVNEKHGNRVGDEVLTQFAAVLRGALRQEDMLVRYGGEEFLVLLPEVPGPGAVVVAGRLRKAAESAKIQIGQLDIPLTVSVGVSARLDEGPESIEGLLARADEALMLAKQRGRNRVVALSLGRSIAA
jgi:diguanylate cyclase (GGDEF)-like protein